jgi:ribosomal protein L7Ae-like RNA K-turn-binding protein
VVPDPNRRLPGRGVYLCYDRDCIEKAVKQGQFQRGFRMAVQDVIEDELLEASRHQLREQMSGLIAMSRKSGKLMAGTSQVIERLGREPFKVIVLAEDISIGRAEKICSKARACNVEVVHLMTKDQLGHLVGKSESSALGLRPGGLADSFMQIVSNFGRLSGEH